MVRLDSVSRSQLHQTFQEAFADYVVDMTSLSEERLRIRCAKNAVDWQLSVGAFDGDRMVGFTLIGIDRWGGALGAFDAATGIVPSCRGQGLAQRMFDHAQPGLEERGVERFVLEVITDNDPAIRAYAKAGFEISRRFRCVGLERTRLPSAPHGSGPISVRPVSRAVIGTFESEAAWLPSWENSFAAIARIPDELLCLGAFAGKRCVGGLAYSPAMDWVMALVVKAAYRRQGIGTRLVGAMAKTLPAEVERLRLINVDTSDSAMLEFLDRLGFEPLVDQYEMVRPI